MTTFFLKSPAILRPLFPAPSAGLRLALCLLLSLGLHLLLLLPGGQQEPSAVVGVGTVLRVNLVSAPAVQDSPAAAQPGAEAETRDNLPASSPAPRAQPRPAASSSPPPRAPEQAAEPVPRKSRATAVRPTPAPAAAEPAPAAPARPAETLAPAAPERPAATLPKPAAVPVPVDSAAAEPQTMAGSTAGETTRQSGDRPATESAAAATPAASEQPAAQTAAAAAEGGDFTDARPRYQSNPLPEYPYLARQRHWEGEVWLLVSVSARGRVEDLEVAASSGYGILDKSALHSVRRWQFFPAQKAGVPVASRVKVPVRFELRD